MTSLTTAVKFPKAEGYNILVGSKYYRTAANPQTPIQFGTRDSLAQRSDDAGSIYQNVLDLGYAWGRTDLSGGEGLDWSPRQISLNQQQVALDEIRFWDSEGINISRPDTQGDQYTLRLARTLTVSDIDVTDPKDITTTSDFIYIADGDTISWYSSWDDPTPISDTPAGGTDVVALAAAPNDSVMAVLADGTLWHKGPLDIAFAEIYTAQAQGDAAAQGVWYVNGRFIMSAFDTTDNGQLWEMLWDGTDWATSAEFDTADSPFWSVVESGPAIVAACGDGTVRSYTPDNGAGGSFLLLPRSRTTMPEGESPILLGANAGVLLIFTTSDSGAADRQEVRVYQAEVLDARFDFVVGQMQLRREWKAVEHEPLTTRNMTNTRDEIFFFVKEEVNRSGIYSESLWRFDIVTGGMNRLVTDKTVGSNLNGVVIFDDIAGAIDFSNNNIVVSDPTLLQEFGYMIFPNITFGLNTDISWIATVVEAHNLVESGGQVELWRSTDTQAILDWQDPSWVMVQRLSSQGASNIEVALQGLTSRTLALQLRMFSSEGSTQSPQVTRTAIRGIPAHRDFIMMVPFNVSDMVSAPGRKPIRIPGLGNRLHEEVLALVGKNVEATVIDPFVRFQGIVNNVSEPVTYVAHRGSVTRHVMVEFRGSRLPGTATPTATGDDGMGLGTMGLATMGLGQTETT